MKRSKLYHLYHDRRFIKVYLQLDSYRINGSLAVTLYGEDGDLFGVITVNLPGGPTPPHAAFVDSNNYPWVELFLENNDIAHPTGDFAHSGYCTYPLYKFNMEKFQETPTD